MSQRLESENVGSLWMMQLESLYYSPTIAPRGIPCHEITNANIVLKRGLNNIIHSPVRNLQYRFMVAEWLWIWFGRDDVKTIERYNRHIAQFSDNGVDFNGAYGVPVKAQWPRILELLQSDPDTRQAVIVIYRTPTHPTKDIPCTLTLQFLIRRGELHMIANMRSSDIWLGLPYDIFNFTMLANIMAAQLNLNVGGLSLNLGSSHLYESNFEKASKTLIDYNTTTLVSPLLKTEPPAWLEHVLVDQARMGFNDHEWGRYARCLLAQTNIEALRELTL